MTGSWELATDTSHDPSGLVRPHHQAIPWRPRARGRQLLDRRGDLPCALRRERCRQEHARKDPRRHLSARWRPRRGVRHARRFFRAAAGARRRHRHRPSGARVLRQPLGGGEPLSRGAARAAHLRLARRDGEPGAGDARGHRRRHRRPPDRPRAHHRAAAGGADRGGDRPRRPRHRLRRADEQPVAARSRPVVRA